MHLRCVGFSLPPRRPYTCSTCWEVARKLNLRDVMLDLELHNYLVHKTVPRDAVHEHRVR